RHAVGQNVPPQQTRIAHRQGFGGLNVREGFHGEYATADDARVDGDAYDTEGNHHVGGAWFQDEHDDNGEEKDWERQHNVHEAHDHVIEGATVKSGDDP